MRYLLRYAFLIFFFSSISLQAQNWLGNGTTWHYTEGRAFSGRIDYLQITVEKDTLIKGLNCKKITKNRDLFCSFHEEVEYAYESGNQIHLYNPDFDQFQVLYDFNLVAGDKIYYPVLDSNTNIGSGIRELDSMVLTINSVNTVTINGRSLKRQYASLTYRGELPQYSSFQRNLIITEGIGSDSYFFYYERESDWSCDGNYSMGLRCYEDSYLGFYETGIADSCTEAYDPIGLKENGASPVKIELSPNPAKRQIHLSGLEQSSLYPYRLSDFKGSLLKKGKLKGPEPQINIQDLKPGLYFLNINGTSIRFLKE